MLFTCVVLKILGTVILKAVFSLPADKAPLSKSLLLVPSALSLLLALLLPHCQRFFVYDLQAVKDEFQVSSAPLVLGGEKVDLFL